MAKEPGTPGEEQGLGIPEMAVGLWDSAGTWPERNGREKAINVSPNHSSTLSGKWEERELLQWS